MNPDLSSELQAARAELVPWFATAIADPGLAGRSYAPGKWTLHELLIHLADTESVLLDRVRRLAVEPKPLLWAFDQDAWAIGLAYRQRSLAQAELLFTAARDTVIEIVDHLPATAMDRTGVHSERGKVTLAECLAGIARHTRHHLGQIRAIAESRPWDAAQALTYR
jgi:uncharacterized damage-inducible protein DinB